MAADSIPRLLADIGGTNARFALLRSSKTTPITALKLADYANVSQAIAEFLKIAGGSHQASEAVLGAAGPVATDRCWWYRASDG